VWLDLETSGVDVESKAILEVAMVITDKDLNVIAEGPELVIYQPDGVLEKLDDWCKKQHRASGLIDEVRRSSISLEQAESQLIRSTARHGRVRCVETQSASTADSSSATCHV